MKQYISEEEAMYMDVYHGQFSRKLAEWAIENMAGKNPVTGKVEPIAMIPEDEVLGRLQNNGVVVPDACVYTAWYLYHMAIADYPKTCRTEMQRADFVEETLCDPDGDTSNVLACFVAKMCNSGVPIYWERYI